MADYILPSNVHSPKKHWALRKILDDQGATGIALAIGHWDGKAVLAMRWNGNVDRKIGNPQSSGHPTWFILPGGHYWEAIISALPKDKQILTRNFLTLTNL